MAGSYLNEILGDDEKVDAAAGGDESSLPTANESTAFARAANKPVYSLNCRLGKDGFRSFQYVQLDSNSSFRSEAEGQIIVLRFAGTKIWEITINGLNLIRLYDYLMQHRMPWIAKSDRGFSAVADKDPVIRGIDIKEIEREG